MERQEPTLGKDAGLESVEFRPRIYRGPTRPTHDSSDFWLKAGICLAVVVVVAMGLIEWNARRQAAAMTAEIMRPMTPNEQREFDPHLAQMAAEDAQELAVLRSQLWQDRSAAQSYEPEPLKPGQRCMQGRRLQRIENGWTQLREPCWTFTCGT
ncbi:hypothetical protein VDF90_07420 [Xanthomonas campestris pv. raphani]|uniref:hypothetical protein n=1 Tax=Xanthomonas campestris TaxID=339 RepID=UPI002B22769E|nr:hypothetical protein [Xanthomonas campestris]MEA9787079.1 hypothetical protein [Xanthomonas campestris pv. raphani]